MVRVDGDGAVSTPPAESRHWVHPSELPSFENLPTTATARPTWSRPACVIVLMAVLLVAGGVVLGEPRPGDAQPRLTSEFGDVPRELPASARAAAADTVELTITFAGTTTKVAALVLPHNLAVTTTVIPINAGHHGQPQQQRPTSRSPWRAATT